MNSIKIYFSDRQVLAAVCLCAISLIMFYLVLLAPYMTDNFIFSKTIHPGYAKFYSGSSVTSSPLTISSAFGQAWELYFTWCGRFTGNLAVFLLFLLPHWLYALLAAAAYGLYILLILMCVFGRDWRYHFTPGWILGIAALLWAGIPSYGEAFFWLSVGGQIALLGQALVFLPFRFALDKPIVLSKPTFTLALSALLFLGGIAVAMLDYATSASLAPTSIICVLYIWWRNKPVIPWALASCCTGLCLGACATLMAPGNACRLLITTDTDVSSYLTATWLERILSWLVHLPSAALMQGVPLIFLLYGCVRLAKAYPNHWLYKIPVSAWLFLCPALLTHCAYLFTPWPPARAFATTSVQLIICACIIFAAVPKTSFPSRIFNCLRAVLVGYCSVSLLFAAYQFNLLNGEFGKREEMLTAAYERAKVPPFSVKPTSHQPLKNNLGDISTDSDYWINRAVASFYGLKGVELIPRDGGTGCYEYKAPDDGALEIKIKLRKERFEVSLDASKQVIHLYYYGFPGVVAYLPFGLDNVIYKWLSSLNPDDWGLRLVPFLTARVDLDEAAPVSERLDIESAQKIWIVAPGEPWWSLNIIPLINICEKK